jgi:hypothetical protein
MKIKLTESQFKKLLLREDYYKCSGEWKPVCAKNTQNGDTIVYENDCVAETSASEVLYFFDDVQKNMVKRGDYCSSSADIEKGNVVDSFIESVIEELRGLQTKMTKTKDDVCEFLENVCYGIEGGGKEIQKQIKSTVDCAATENDILGSSIIRKGCYNDLVGTIQTMLVALNYDIGDFGPKKDGVDQKYGKFSMEGIRKFQNENGLKNDGITEKNTYKLLKQKYEELTNK